MEQQDPGRNKSSDRSADQSRRSGRSEKRDDQVQAGDGGKDGLHSGVVRGGSRGSGKHQTSNQVVESQPKKKLTLKDFPQTAPAANSIENLNKKPAGHSISPARSSPSPPRKSENFSLDSSRDLGDRFGFMDFGPRDSSDCPGQLRESYERPSNKRDQQASSTREQQARAALNAQSEFLMRQAVNLGGQAVDGGQGLAQDQVLLNDRHARPQYPDLSGSQPVPNFFAGMLQMQAQMLEQNARWQKLHEERTNLEARSVVADANIKSTPVVVGQVPAGAATDDSVSESDDELEVDWAGQPIEQKAAEIFVSEPALEFWSSLLGVDDKGVQTGAFKSLAKKTKKVRQYVEGKRAMNPQEVESEIPRMWGWHLKEEEELVANQRILGAVAAATCVSVDAARATVDDLRATGHDFENGVIEDPSAEAAKLCAAVADVLEEKIIANSIQSLKFNATAFGSFTLKRRTLALRQVSDPETKRVLDKTPPNDEYLFGGKVKESVQKSRDSNQLKRFMQPQKRDWKPSKVFKPNFRKDGGGRGAPRSARPMSDRFKGGDRKWRGKNKRFMKKKDPKEDE